MPHRVVNFGCFFKKKDILDLNFPDYPFVFPILKSCNFSKRLIFLYPAKNNPMKCAILQKYRVGNTEYCITKIAQFIWEFIWIYSHGFYVAQKRVTYLVPTTKPCSCKIKGVWVTLWQNGIALHYGSAQKSRNLPTRSSGF